MEPIATPTDRDLATRVAGAGDEDAFRNLFDRHTPRLLRFVGPWSRLEPAPRPRRRLPATPAGPEHAPVAR